MTQRDVLLNVRSKIDAECRALPSNSEGKIASGAYKNALSIIDQELDKTPPLVIAYEASPDMDSGGAG